MGGPGRRRLRAVGGVAAGATLAFLFATLPAAARWAEMLAWVTRIASRSGRYGESAGWMPNASTLIGNLGSLLWAAKGWYLWLLLAAAGAALALRQTRDGDDDARQLRGMTLFSLTAIALGQGLVLRSFDAHYLLPAAVAAAGLAAVAAHAPPLRHQTALRAAVLALAAGLLAKHLVGDARTHLARNEVATNGRAALTSAVAHAAPATPAPVVVYGYGTPMPSLALRYFATDPQLLHRVETLYPREGHLGPGDRLRLPAGARAWDVMVLQRRDSSRVAAPMGAAAVEHVGAWEVLVPVGRRTLAEVAP
jgi:hypothetical protein